MNPSPSLCCERCYVGNIDGGAVVSFCANDNCPCHSKEEAKAPEYLFDPFVGWIKNPQATTLANDTNWEERWEAQSFIKAMKNARDFNDKQYTLIMKLLHPFIRDLLKKEREATVDYIEKHETSFDGSYHLVPEEVSEAARKR